MSTEQIAEIGGILFLVAIAVIAITPTKRDDEAFSDLVGKLPGLRGIFASLSPGRKALGGGAVAGILALLAALLGGCGAVGLSPADVAEAARIMACKGCAAIGGAKGAACAAALGCS